MLSPNEDAPKHARLLIVDDERRNVEMLERVLKAAGYAQLKGITDGRQTLPVYLEYRPDLIILDLKMPHLDGLAVMRQLASRMGPNDDLPILVLTAETDPDTKYAVLHAGATDLLTKPFDIAEVLLRIRNLLRTHLLHLELQVQNEHLEERVRERTRTLEEAQTEIIHRLALAAEYRDDATGEHIRRVGDISALLFEALGKSRTQVELMRLAAQLHDLGKIGIPDRILLKPGRLTAKEFDQMKAHVTIGAKTLSGSRFALLQMAEEIALTHHECWDGTGYSGLKREEIPLTGRVVAVADVFDALTHVRPYKQAWPLDQARSQIESLSGKQFDPVVVDAFLSLLDREGSSLLRLDSTPSYCGRPAPSDALSGEKDTQHPAFRRPFTPGLGIGNVCGEQCPPFHAGENVRSRVLQELDHLEQLCPLTDENVRAAAVKRGSPMDI
jgi:putative two-component system response regulator